MFDNLSRPTRQHHRRSRELLLEFYAESKERFYSVSLDGEDSTIPIITKGNWLHWSQDIDAVFGGFCAEKSTRVDESFIREYRRYLQKTHHNSRPFWNGDVLRPVGISADAPTLEFEITDYFSFLSDCLSVAAETYDAASRPTEERGFGTGSLPLRHQLIPDYDALVDLRRRHTKLGVSSFCVLNPQNRPPVGIFARRSAMVAEHPLRYSVLPAGTLDWSSEDDSQIVSGGIKNLILREFSEELLDSSDSGPPRAEYEIIHNLKSMLRGSGADLWVTGFGIELLRGQPELSALLYIRDQDLSQAIIENLTLNWEIEETDSSQEILWDTDDRSFVAAATDVETVPATTMAVCQGLQLLTQEYDFDLSYSLRTGTMPDAR